MNTLIAKGGTVVRPLLNLIYRLFKRGPTRNRVAFFTRQADCLTPDFKLIIAELKRRSPDTEIVYVCKRLNGGVWGACTYLFTFFRQMSALGTARIAVIDGYIPVVSYLDQRDDLYVLQTWHAFGAFKKFSYHAINTEGGRSGAIAQSFRMHANYSAVLCGGEASRQVFARAFNMDVSKILIMPLPRYDELIAVAEKGPVAGTEDTVLYAPTFRDTDTEINLTGIRKLVRACSKQGLTLILKLHPLLEGSMSADDVAKLGCTLAPRISAQELMSMVGHVVTDYSAIAFEAAVAEKPVWFYMFDASEYVNSRGLILNPQDVIPSRCFADADELVARIKNDGSVTAEQRQFKEKFVSAPKTTATRDIVELILKQLPKGTK